MNYYRPALSLMLTASLLLNTGCATIFNGSSETLHIESEEPGSKIYLDGEYIGTRDAVVRVSKQRDPVITVKKAGCENGTQSVGKVFDGVTLLGLFFDLGLISILLVDWAATGAVQKFERTNFTVSPHCEQAKAPAGH